jgi:hypothetical protein
MARIFPATTVKAMTNNGRPGAATTAPAAPLISAGRTSGESRREVSRNRVLLDANVLIALVVADHVQRDATETWLAGTTGRVATCPITQGSLVRLPVPGRRVAIRPILRHPRGSLANA